MNNPQPAPPLNEFANRFRTPSLGLRISLSSANGPNTKRLLPVRKKKNLLFRYGLALICAITFCPRLIGQSTPANALPGADSSPLGSARVPLHISFSGNLRELNGKAAVGVQNVILGLYESEIGGDSLWEETQTITPDPQGDFAVVLGSSNGLGIPVAVFAGGAPRWIGITPNDGIQRPRSQLTSVPYAFEAADAETLNGRASQEFVTFQQLNALFGTQYQAAMRPGLAAQGLVVSSVQGGYASAVPYQNAELLNGFADTAFAKVADSNLFLKTQTLAGGLLFPPGKLEPGVVGLVDSAPLDFQSSWENSPSPRPAEAVFRWSSRNIPTPSAGGPTAQLSLYFGFNGAPPSPTGFSFNSDGTMNFAPGQQLPPSAVAAALSGSQGGGSGLGPGGVENPIVNTAGFVWKQTPTSSGALQIGENTVTLTPCPRGVNGTDAFHYLYVAGTGNPEVVLITGGSCTALAPSGTISFSTTNAHPAGYSIGTATDGVQEAVISAYIPKQSLQVARQVLIDPGPHLFRARLSIRTSSITINASGATITCAMNDICIMMGDPANADAFSSIVLQGVRVIPGVKGGRWPAVVDNANGSEVSDFGPENSPISGATFGSLVQVYNDQAATLDRINTTLSYSWGSCTVDFCPTAILGPGPFSTHAGVLWVQNSNLSLQCTGNAIDNHDGNTLSVNNSVVQGWAQFGIRASTVYQQNTVQLSGVYEEEDGDCNPLGTGSAGLIVEGGVAHSSGSGIGGYLPSFSNTGTAQYFYYVVVHSSTLGTSSAYLAGQAASDGSTPINVLWNRVGTSGTITYDVLKVAGNGGPTMQAPYGTGAFAVAVGLLQTASCTTMVCSVIDNPAIPAASYTVNQDTTYWPSLSMWPGTVILTSAYDTQNTGGGNPTMFYTDSLPGGAIVNSAGNTYPSVFAQECEQQGNWTAIWMQCIGGNSVGNDWGQVTATLLQLSSSQSGAGGLKGRLIFELPPYSEVAPTHTITLSDSNTLKTLATPDNRPSFDAADTYIGNDGGWIPSNNQLSFGAPVSISNYINNTGDGVNFLERLTATSKMFRVPVQMSQVMTGSPNNVDAAGVLRISGGTSASYTFAGIYTNSPSCSLTPLSDPTETGVFWATITNTVLTVNVKSPGDISFAYQCWGLN